jgi:hypothetical protein
MDEARIVVENKERLYTLIEISTRSYVDTLYDTFWITDYKGIMPRTEWSDGYSVTYKSLGTSALEKQPEWAAELEWTLWRREKTGPCQEFNMDSLVIQAAAY